MNVTTYKAFRESFLSFEKYVFFSVGVAMTDYGSEVIVESGDQTETAREFLFIVFSLPILT